MPVPPVTTWPIRAVSWLWTAGDNGPGSPVVAVVVCAGSNTGGRHCPVMTAAATVAIWSGLAVTCPCPMASAAVSTSSPPAGKCPPTVDRPSFRATPKPNWAAAARSWSAERWACSAPMKAVLHDTAKARDSERLPADSDSKLWNTLPSTVMVPGQVSVEVGVNPASSSPSVVITLNVDPGG